MSTDQDPEPDIAARLGAVEAFVASFPTRKAAAEAIGVDNSAISKVLGPGFSLGRLTAMEGAIARWQIGQGRRDVSADTSPADVFADDGADLSATVAVPQYGHVGAGDGRVPPRQVGVLHVTVAEYAQDFGEPPRVIGDRYRPAGRFGYFIVDGDSAAPVYFDRERVPVQLLDPETRFANDLLYVFRWRGEYQIKRLRLQADNTVRASSLNPSIDPFFFTVADEEDFAVVALARASPKQDLYTALVGRFLRTKNR